jgi:hypothetical protein
MFSAGVSANDYNSFVVFGDSLPDPGNAFALSGEQSVPPYETLYQGRTCHFCRSGVYHVSGQKPG